MKKLIASIMFLSALVIGCDDMEDKILLEIPEPEKCESGQLSCNHGGVEICVNGEWEMSESCLMQGMECTTNITKCGEAGTCCVPEKIYGDRIN